jgi:non-haem Fe2+, alpha-ketoglutarate-dependent halogenase
MGNHLSREAIQRYRSDGYLFPVPALSREEAARHMRDLERIEAIAGKEALKLLRGKAHLMLTSLYELVHHPAVLDAVEGIIGPDILVWNSSLFLKEPQDPAYVQWHQDVYDFDEHDDAIVSAWIALLPSTRQNGAMRVVPGSWRNRHVEHKPVPAGAPALIRDNLEIAVDVDEAKAVDLLLDPGEMSLHHMYTYHGSPPNRSMERRCGFAVRYVAPHVARKGDPYAATVVRGSDRLGHFGKDPMPDRDLDPELIDYATRYGKPRLPR